MQAIPIDERGRFAGYASVFERADEAGDLVMPGAFAKSLARRGAHQLRMLFQHDPKEPVGTWEVAREDGYGLWVEGRLVPGVPRADALRRLIERRAIDGLSIGFRTERATRELYDEVEREDEASDPDPEDTAPPTRGSDPITR